MAEVKVFVTRHRKEVVVQTRVSDISNVIQNLLAIICKKTECACALKCDCKPEVVEFCPTHAPLWVKLNVVSHGVDPVAKMEVVVVVRHETEVGVGIDIFRIVDPSRDHSSPCDVIDQLVRVTQCV